MKLLSLKDARTKLFLLFLLSLMHLATDGLCSYLIFAKLYPENPGLSFIVFVAYNLMAFVTQSPLGMLVDKHNYPKTFLCISVAAIILGYLCSKLCLAAVLFIGLGNALFHVVGGKYVTDKSGNNVSHLGIFVSTGAIGLVLGQRFVTLTGLVYIFFAILVVCTLIMFFSDDATSKEYLEEYSANGNNAAYALLAVVAVVFVRAFIGKVATGDFESTQFIFLAIAVATALGKAVGGIVSRLIGTVPTVIASMSIAAICLTLGCNNPYTYVLGIFAFNFSMPITLYFANIILKGKEGFAFGTLAAILMPGYLIAMTFNYSIWIKTLTAVLCGISSIVIAVISKRIKNAN